MKSKFKKVVGILGGMGPFATLVFFEKILELTSVKKDWDHLRLIIDNNPHIPSRSRSYLFQETSPVKGMLESCKRLKKYPVDFIVLPCNSATYFLSEVEKKIDINILNIVDVTVTSVAKNYSEKLRVAAIGGIIVYKEKLYKKGLEKSNFIYVEYDIDLQAKVLSLIEKIKLDKKNKRVKDEFKKIITILKKKYKVDLVILACTELSIFSNIKVSASLVDSSTELAKRTINLAK